MMSQCLVPKWNPKQQQQQQQQLEAQNSSISHHHNNPMSNYEVAELTWENGQLAMHGLSGLPPSAHTKPTWSSRAHETLESIVQQATICHQYPNSSNFNINMPQHHDDHAPTSISSTVAPSARNTTVAVVDEKPGQAQTVPMMPRKRTRSDSGENNETTMMTWASLESGRSFKSGKSKTIEEDSPSQCGSENREAEEEREVKGETGRSNPTRRNRAAAIHNQSERKRRDRINQRMKALQRLVPNASKTDKASMLDEVIEYLKQLQAQVEMMMSMRGIPPPPHLLMMPFAMQQQQQFQSQMSMLARMGIGMGLGLGLLNMNTTPAAAAVPSPSLPQLTSFMMPPLIQAQAQAQAQALAPPKPEPGSTPTTNASVSLPADPYATILSQSMNMDFLNNMAALYRQQMRQNNIQGFSSHSQQRHGQDDG